MNTMRFDRFILQQLLHFESLANNIRPPLDMRLLNNIAATLHLCLPLTATTLFMLCLANAL